MRSTSWTLLSSVLPENICHDNTGEWMVLSSVLPENICHDNTGNGRCCHPCSQKTSVTTTQGIDGVVIRVARKHLSRQHREWTVLSSVLPENMSRQHREWTVLSSVFPENICHDNTRNRRCCHPCSQKTSVTTTQGMDGVVVRVLRKHLSRQHREWTVLSSVFPENICHDNTGNGRCCLPCSQKTSVTTTQGMDGVVVRVLRKHLSRQHREWMVLSSVFPENICHDNTGNGCCCHPCSQKTSVMTTQANGRCCHPCSQKTFVTTTQANRCNASE